MAEEIVGLDESGAGDVDISQGQENVQPQEVQENVDVERVETDKQTEFNTRFDKHPRWIEREEKLKALEQKLADMESKLNPTKAEEDPDLKMLVDMGFAKEKAEQLLKVLESRAERKLQPLKAESETNALERGFSQFFAGHPEIKAEPKLADEMDRLFGGLSPEIQKIYSRDITSLDLLLAKAKENIGYAYEKGKHDGISNAKIKKEAGNMAGSPSGEAELTEESISRMKPEEFNRREKEIMAKLRQVEADEE